jgi:flagellar biosynthesis GTPase FlhF
MAYKFCPECGFKFEREYKFCPGCGLNLVNFASGKSEEKEEFIPEIKDTIVSSPVVNSDDFNLESAFDKQLDEKSSLDFDYDKELNRAEILCKRKMFSRAAIVYEALINKNFDDVNAYIGLIRVSSENFTKFDGDQLSRDISALLDVVTPDSTFKESKELIDLLKKKNVYEKWCEVSGETKRQEQAAKEKYRQEVYKKLFGKAPSSSELLGTKALDEIAKFKRVDEYIKREEERKIAEIKAAEEEKKRKELEKKLKREREEAERLKKLEEERQKREAERLAKEEAERKKREEEQARLDAIKKAKEEAELKEKERREREEKIFKVKEIKGKKTLLRIGVKNLGEYVIPEGVDAIDENVFVNVGAHTVVLPSTVYYLGENALSGVTECVDMRNAYLTYMHDRFLKNLQIKRLILPTKLDTTFDFEPLKQLKELESIEIYDHPKLTVENGALILKEKKQVVFYTPKYEQKVLDLTSLKTPVESVYFGSFKNAENLEKIILPESVKEIDDFTFEGCSNLTEVVAPSVKQVGNYAFSNCKKLEKFDFSFLTHIGVNAFENCYRLKEINLSNAKRIADKAFVGCENIKFDSLESVTHIGEEAFKGCNMIEAVVVSENATIGRHAFENCNSIKKVVVGKGSTIGWGAFYKNENLTKLELERDLTIDEFAFSFCKSLRTVVIKENTAVDVKAFASCFAVEKVKVCKDTDLGKQVFQYCTHITSVDVGENCYIGENCFDGASFLKDLTLSKGVIIEERAFNFCRMEKIKFKEKTTIKSEAFKDCRSLKEITVETGTVIESDAFENSGLKFVEIPKGCKVERNAFPAGCKVKKPLFG